MKHNNYFHYYPFAPNPLLLYGVKLWVSAISKGWLNHLPVMATVQCHCHIRYWQLPSGASPASVSQSGSQWNLGYVTRFPWRSFPMNLYRVAGLKWLTPVNSFANMQITWLIVANSGE